MYYSFQPVFSYGKVNHGQRKKSATMKLIYISFFTEFPSSPIDTENSKAPKPLVNVKHNPIPKLLL